VAVAGLEPWSALYAQVVDQDVICQVCPVCLYLTLHRESSSSSLSFTESFAVFCPPCGCVLALHVALFSEVCAGSSCNTNMLGSESRNVTG
jgi:hypothetical protein